jgi:hypothetical protein
MSSVLRPAPRTPITAFGRLLALGGATLPAHGRGDGGLIHEDRGNRAHPKMW